MAPELVQVDEQGAPTCEAHHQATDIWAAACAAFIVLTGRASFLTDQTKPMMEQQVDVQRQQTELVS